MNFFEIGIGFLQVDEFIKVMNSIIPIIFHQGNEIFHDKDFCRSEFLLNIGKVQQNKDFNQQD